MLEMLIISGVLLAQNYASDACVYNPRLVRWECPSPASDPASIQAGGDGGAGAGSAGNGGDSGGSAGAGNGGGDGCK